MNPTRYFRQFMGLCRPGIYVLVDNRHKKVAIIHTNDLLRSISATMTQLKSNTHKCKKLNEHKEWLSLEILETVEDRVARYLRHSYWVEHYKKLGYKMFFYKKAIEFKVRVVIEPDFTPSSDNLLVYVVLKNTRGDKLVVGVFNAMPEAEAWVEAVYRPMNIISPVYADNELSQEYFRCLKK